MRPGGKYGDTRANSKRHRWSGAAWSAGHGGWQHLRDGYGHHGAHGDGRHPRRRHRPGCRAESFVSVVSWANNPLLLKMSVQPHKKIQGRWTQPVSQLIGSRPSFFFRPEASFGFRHIFSQVARLDNPAKNSDFGLRAGQSEKLEKSEGLPVSNQPARFRDHKLGV